MPYLDMESEFGYVGRAIISVSCYVFRNTVDKIFIPTDFKTA